MVGEVWLLVVFKVIHRRNQLNEWFASFEKAPSGFRFHIYYFKPLQLDPWGFPGLPGGVFFSKLPFPSWDKCLFFSHIHHAPPTSAPPHSESPGQPAVTWGPGAWWGAFSWEQRLAGCPLPHACLRHGKPGGPVLAHWWSLLEALRFERKRDFLMDFPLQEYQSAPEKH